MIGSKIGMSQEATVEKGAKGIASLHFVNKYKVECVGRDGEVKWAEEFENLVTNVGLDSNLDVYFGSATKIASWYMGLKNTGSPAAGDTMASHGGWVENENYEETTRPEVVFGSVSGQAIGNSGNAASFSIDTAGQTIAGIFVVSDNTKGGTTGTLYAVGDFSSARNVDDGDTLNVTVTFNAASGV